MLAKQFLAILSVAGLIAAAPQAQGRPGGKPAPCPMTMCIDGINPDCGIPWGGCYDICKPKSKPTMPPCPKPTKSLVSITKRPSPRPTAPPSSSRSLTPVKPTPPANCSSRTVCVDYVNSCGQWYGG
ncbi:hypothetical protein CTRI78_v001318 [Colletotrichum trifolii]|nr:hypothetical protein CTRI78_v001318 [Colletotrichum trifolii]